VQKKIIGNESLVETYVESLTVAQLLEIAGKSDNLLEDFFDKQSFVE
jgi:hypothetical protein